MRNEKLECGNRVTVGMGSCGIAAGAAEIFRRLREYHPVSVGCVGMCYLEPIVAVDRQMYVKVNAKAVEEIIKLLERKENDAALYEISPEDLGILRGQNRIVLRNCGVIDPGNIDEYLAREGYRAIQACVQTKTPQEVIAEIKLSGLAGRGGAGFPTWFKWQAARDAAGEAKYVICNADEGDPGAFMDRAVIEGDPHALIEGMMAAAYAIGAAQGVVYVRAEYPLAIQRLETALRQAREKNLLGQNIFGSKFSFDIKIKAGAGAFVCGEETALIASLEGERGMPRLKPPFPAQKGLWGKPSNINNVETYANMPWILRSGGSAFAAIGTEHSKGTKVFALTGKIAKGGLVEVPMGSSIRDVVFGLGGGIDEPDGVTFKSVQMGGPSGGCIPAALADTPIDYKSLAATGAIMGSGGMVGMDESTCMVDMARFFLDFTVKESCGKCVHCRIGNKRMLEILRRICAGEGREGDIALLEALSEQIKAGSLCALGQTAPNPVLTTIKYFRGEYEDHIARKKCTAHRCRPLLTYTIDEAKCAGCTLCARGCPAGAIAGALKRPHTIDNGKCAKCGACKDVCKFGAVTAL